MVVSLTRKRVTTTESKARVSRVGLPRPTYGVCIAYAKKKYRYGIKGTGYPAAAPTHPPGGGGVGRGRSGRASARWRALPRRPPTHNATRRPPWRARQPRLRRSLRRAGVPCRGGLPRTMPCTARRGAPANRAYAGRSGSVGVGAWSPCTGFSLLFGFCRVLEVRLLNIMFVWERRGRVWMGLFPFFSLCRRVRALSGS